MKNKNLHDARRNKNDEFYTMLCDIEKELSNYLHHFGGKTVYCNCDDPESNFVRYFAENFKTLGLKKFIATGFHKKKLIVITPEGYSESDVSDGDFRSDECVEFLKESDIVVTNPPFSLFREYIAQLMEYEKEFLVIGNINAVSYGGIFPLIKDNHLWLGVSQPKWFVQPEGYPPKNLKGISRWYTNLEHKKRNQPLVLRKCYEGNELSYPKYDNYDAIEVGRTASIPSDYKGVMGVPITFLDKHCPHQFVVLGMAASSYDQNTMGIPFLGDKDGRPLVQGKNTYARIFIRRK